MNKKNHTEGATLLFFLPKSELGFKYFYNHLNTNELYSMNLKPWTQ